MASSSFHARSYSLPSRPHPLVSQCNEHLERLKASHETSSSSSSSPSFLSHNLQGLQDLHDCVEKLVQLPLIQQALLQECEQNLVVDELLDGSLRLLDACTAAKDSLIHTKECNRELQSIIRRRKRGDLELVSEANKFLTSKKVVKMAILKALEKMKCSSTRKITNKIMDKEKGLVYSLLKQVEVVALSVLESLLRFMCGSTQAKPSKWSLVSKIINSNKRLDDDDGDESEFAQVDAALQSFVLNLASKSLSENTSNLQNHLGKLESRIDDLEEGMEFLFRKMIKMRVSLLNILNN